MLSRVGAGRAPCWHIVLGWLVITLTEEVRGEGRKQRTIQMSAPFSSAELRVEMACVLLSPLCLAAGVHAGLNKRGVARFRSRGLP